MLAGAAGGRTRRRIAARGHERPVRRCGRGPRCRAAWPCARPAADPPRRRSPTVAGGGRRVGTKGQHAQQRHLEAEPRIGRERQVAAAGERNLVVKLHVLGRHRAAQAGERLRRRTPRPLGRRRARSARWRCAAERPPDRRARDRSPGRRDRARPLARATRDRPHATSASTMRVTWPRSMVPSMARVFASLKSSAAERDQLIEQAQPIAHAAVGGTRQMRECRGLEVELLGGRDHFHALGDEARGQTLQAELQAARQHGDGQLLRVRGREQEFDVRRRLFERLQQRVEGMVRQHVHFVDEVHLVAPAGSAHIARCRAARGYRPLWCARRHRPR